MLMLLLQGPWSVGLAQGRNLPIFLMIAFWIFFRTQPGALGSWWSPQLLALGDPV